MTNSIRCMCALLSLGASFGLAQSTSPSNVQNTGQTTPSTAASAGATSATTSAQATGSMSGDPAAEASLQKMEQELAQGIKAKDTAPFVKYIDDNIVAFGPGWRATGKAEVLKSITTSPCTVNSTALSDFTYKWISADAVLMTYTANDSQTCQGKNSSTVAYESSLWQKKDGKWLAIYHQETTREPMPATAAAS